MSLLKELWSFMKVRKKFWLLPVLMVTLILGLILVLAPTAVAPFIYALF
jgi:competence protein ComGC